MSDMPFGDSDSRLTESQRSYVRGYRAAIRDLDNERARIEDALEINDSTIIERMIGEVEHNCLSRMMGEMMSSIEHIEDSFIAINNTGED